MGPDGTGHHPIPIAKVDRRLQHSAYGLPALAMSVPFMGVGGYFALAGFGIWPLPGHANAPLAIIGFVGLAFATAGAWLGALALRSLLRARGLSAHAAAHPDEPWWSDYPWDARGIRDQPAARSLSAIFGAAFLALFLVPFNWWAFGSGQGPVMVKIIIGVFDCIALAIVGVGVHRLIGAMKFGRTQLTFARFPFHPGERLEAFLSPVRELELEGVLRFVEEHYEAHGHGERRRVQHVAHALWRSPVSLEPGPHRDELTVSVELPRERELVNAMQASPGARYWELLVQAKSRGVDFRTTFPLPVYPKLDTLGAVSAGPAVERLPPLKPRRSAHFELKLAVLLLAVAGAGAWTFSDRLAQLLEQGAVRLRVEKLDGVYSDAMDVQIGADGSVWILSKYTLHRFRAGEAGSGAAVLGAGAPKAPATLASVGDTRASGLWLGAWDGTVMRWRPGAAAGTLQSWQPEPSADPGRIRALTEFRGRVYALGDGLWALDAASGRMSRVPALPRRTGYAFARMRHAAGDILYAALGHEVWRNVGGRWRLHWTAPAALGEVRALLSDRLGSLWAGTDHGVVRLTGHGKAVSRALEGAEVRALAQGREAFWVATWNQGLLRWRPKQPTAVKAYLADARLTDVGVDRNGGLWVTLYGGGARFLPATAGGP